MKQSLVLSILLLSLISPIHARNKPHHDENSPSPSSSSPSPAPGPSNSKCSDVVANMMDCITYITPGSNDTMPTKSCCDSIKSVIEFDPVCICYGLKNAKDMGVVLNNTRAVDMPKTCKLANAPHCDVKIPGAATPSASTPSASTPTSASTPSMSPVSPSSGTPMTSPTSSKSPATSPSSSHSPATSPSSSQSPETSPSSSQSPETSPPLAESPVTSPSSDDSPATTTPSPTSSATNNLSVPILTLVAALVSSIAYF